MRGAHDSELSGCVNIVGTLSAGCGVVTDEQKQLVKCECAAGKQWQSDY